MKQNLFTLLLAIMASMTSLNAEIIKHVKIGDLYYNIDVINYTAEVTYEYEESLLNYSWLTNVNIPASVTCGELACGVTSIGTDAFKCCKGLTSIEIPNSVTSIGFGAFEGCFGMTSVTIPNSVTSIGSYAFKGCTGLKSIEIPNSVTSIGFGAFENCADLSSVTMGNSVTSIGKYAFDGCAALTRVNITDLAAWSSINFQSSGSNPLYNAKHLYLNDSEITELIIPNSVTSIGNYAFSYCESMTSVIIPKSVSSIGSYAFFDCTGLKSVTIGSAVTSIGDYAFEGCKGLTSITIPNSVTSIGVGAFGGCDGLTSVTIPSSVTKIGDNAFENCSNLTSVTWNARNCYCKNSIFPAFITSFSFGNEVKKIPAGICEGMSKLTNIIIPNSVTEIGNSSFYNCTGLNTISLGENVTTYGQDAFAGCSHLASIYNYREKPAKIGTNTFSDVDYFDCKLYVLAGSVDMYKSAGSNWKDFFYIEPIEAVTTQTDVVKVEPTETTAVIAWPSVSGAYTYDLVIKDKKGNPICTLTFNANGQLTSIAFHAPTRNKSQQQTQVAGFSFTVTGLDSGTTYDLTITAKDNNGKTIDKKELSFTTAGSPEALDQISQGPIANSQKFLINGQIFILRGDNIYTIQGQEVR